MIQKAEKVDRFEESEYTMNRLGFGCLRLPIKEGAVDQKQFNQMVDIFMAAGFNYFDTAHTYIDGKSEIAIREGLVKRYPRESFILANKLTTPLFQSKGDIVPLFEKQLEACGVGYFDYYLMHGLSERLYRRFEEHQAFDVVKQLKKDGKVRHIGISFHDKPDVLERILQEHPEIEVVQIQLNYLDYDDPIIEGGRVYEVCRKYSRPVMVMEPVRGGGLAVLPEEAQRCFDSLSGGSPASYALRYAASFDGVIMVLSGMSSVEQVEENARIMKDSEPLTKDEYIVLEQVKEVFRSMGLIPCTACRYCMAGCPKHILIPRLFACLNAKKQFVDWDNSGSYLHYTGTKYGKASDCIGCRQCEEICPQHLPVVELLKEVAKVYDI